MVICSEKITDGSCSVGRSTAKMRHILNNYRLLCKCFHQRYFRTQNLRSEYQEKVGDYHGMVGQKIHLLKDKVYYIILPLHHDSVPDQWDRYV